MAIIRISADVDSKHIPALVGLFLQMGSPLTVTPLGTPPTPSVRQPSRAPILYYPTPDAVRMKDVVGELKIPPQQQQIVAYILTHEKATAKELVQGLEMKITAVHSALQKLRHTEPPLVEGRNQ